MSAKGPGRSIPRDKKEIAPHSVLRESKKVPSDPSKQLVLRPACTVRTWHPQRWGRILLLPASDSSSAADQHASKRRPTIPVETDFSIRPFTRQRRGLPCGFPRSRVNAPGLYLQNHPGSSASPVRFLAPGLVGPFFGLSAARSTRWNPLQSVPSRTLRLSSGRHSPPGPWILRDRSAQPDFRRRRLPLQVARSSFTPRCAVNNFLSNARSGSSFQIRYFPPDSLFLETLGTSNRMHPSVDSSQSKKQDSLSIYFHGNQYLTERIL
jgi:hypothetical protein